ncbi:MAG: DNA primase [Pseudomonadota bacterium]
MKFDEHFLGELKARLRPSDVIGRTVQLKKQGREWAGLSPFTQEKTPSFFVNDEKGFFHCFSSGKHGDIINFLQETERLSFPEAVAKLAEAAGMPLPAPDPAAQKTAERKRGLVDCMEAAQAFFVARLASAEGEATRRYLTGRGLDDATQAEFGLGLAPASGRTRLRDHLQSAGFAVPQMVEAGLLVAPEDGGAPFDRFRNRAMFPIRNAADRVVAFGGRALDPEARAKYLNSPETPLFHKGELLYNYAAARRALGSGSGQGAGGRDLIVCEGYMDVIAVAQAGFPEAVASLGTALTERHLALLWSVSDEPILCFDGDKAGLRAAHRAVDRALPLLKPGKSLRFCFLPDGDDPDDFVRSKGPAAFREALEAAEPLIDVVWRRERDAAPLTTPERRAKFKAQLRALTRGIADPDVRGAYGQEIASRFDAMFTSSKPERAGEARRSRRLGGEGGRFQRSRQAWAVPDGPSDALKRLASASHAQSSTARREQLLLATLVNHPKLLDRFGETLSGVGFTSPDLDGLKSELLNAWALGEDLDREQLRFHVAKTQFSNVLDRLDRFVRGAPDRFARPDADLEDAAEGWLNVLSLHTQLTTLPAELSEAATRLASSMGEAEAAYLRGLLSQKGAAEARSSDDLKEDG